LSCNNNNNNNYNNYYYYYYYFITAIVITLILPVALYGCESWSLTLGVKPRLGVFENGILRRIYGPKKDKITGKWRRLHPEELNPLNAELNPICHLLVFLGDLTFMGLCIVTIFQYTCISNKMQR
jgi:hypothetical protein